MKTILAATDLSERSEKAVERAHQLAIELRARLVVLHVLDSELPSAVLKVHTELAVNYIQEHFVHLRRRRGAHPRISIQHGLPYREILKAADIADVSLIVMGRHRPRPVRDLFLGTTVERVLRSSTQGLLVARNSTVRPYKRICIGLDFSSNAESALMQIAKLWPRAQILGVHAYQLISPRESLGGRAIASQIRGRSAAIQRSSQAKIGALFRRAGLSPKRAKAIVKPGIAEGILRQAVQHERADLIVVATHDEGALNRMIFGSVARNLLINPPTDVLVLKGL